MYSLRAINSDGSSPAGGGVLVDFEKLDLGIPFCDVGSLTFDYALNGSNAALITDQREIAVFDSIGEIPDARFVVEGSNGNRVSKDGVIYRTFSGRSIWKVFDDSIVYGANYPTVTSEDKRSFPSSTPGQILSALIIKAQSLGDLPGITYTFNASTDSNGATWSNVVSIGYDVGIPLLQVIQNLIDQGICEVRMVGRELRVYNPDSLGTDRTTGATPLTLWSGKSYEVPEQRDTRGLKTVAFVKGDNGVVVEVADAAAVATYGRRILPLSQQGIADAGTLSVIGQANIGRVKQPRSERTYAYNLEDTSATWIRPFREFTNGDWVYQDMNGTPERVRVRQITVQMESNGETPKVIVTLNDRFMELEVALARKVNGITNGAKMDGSGNARPADPGGDTLAPNQVVGLIGSTEAYVDSQGATWAQITLDWTAVTTNSDGSAMGDFDRYEILAKRAADTVFSVYTSVSTDIATLSGFGPGQVWHFQVRAVDQSNNAGLPSSTLVVTTATDSTPPPVPSTPVVTDYLGQIRIYWDGRGSANEAMPGDFKHVEVHASATSGFTPASATLMDVLMTSGASIVTDLPYGTTYFVKLVSVDRNGNRSAASTQASATTSRVSGLDVEALAIATSHLGDGAITAQKIADATITSAKIGTAQILNANIANLAVDDAKIGNVAVGKLVAGTLTADITLSARIKTANTGARVEINASGLQAFNASNVQTVNISAATGSATMLGQFATGLAGGGSAYLSMDDLTDNSTIRFWNAGGTNFAFINSPQFTGAVSSIGVNTGQYNVTGTTSGRTRMWVYPSGFHFGMYRNSDFTKYGPTIEATATDLFLRGFTPLGGATSRSGDVQLNASTVRLSLYNSSGTQLANFALTSGAVRMDAYDTSGVSRATANVQTTGFYANYFNASHVADGGNLALMDNYATFENYSAGTILSSISLSGEDILSTGKYQNYTDQGTRGAIFAGRVGFTNLASAHFSYGSTAVSVRCPIVQVEKGGTPIYWSTSAVGTTGFDVTYSATVPGTSVIGFWCFRV